MQLLSSVINYYLIKKKKKCIMYNGANRKFTNMRPQSLHVQAIIVQQVRKNNR